ncbi:YggS family pyridoxal phosphate-dependent enzyme [Candidatus Halobeggiatoa sp. HSG11]|nr:YggS family pyridoxal phosphate-dependent enzyme [Candidatus Halobeggiatoa sp. HSG11]
MTNNNQVVQTIQHRIIQAAQRAGRNAESITLVAVSKKRPIDVILPAYEAGVRHFGENRADELKEKATTLSYLKDVKWHFIGHLQTRQSKSVAQYAHYFHAVDSVKIAQVLSVQLDTFKRNLSVFIQVNISGEKSKGGFDCYNWQNNVQHVENLIKAIKEIAALPNIQILGLMTMAPFDAQEDVLHHIFQSMADLSSNLGEQLPNNLVQQLSMGMSRDFEIAIEEGATFVRIGSAIFA